MDITDFYTIETPPSSSSTSKDSTDESSSFLFFLYAIVTYPLFDLNDNLRVTNSFYQLWTRIK
ncbi:unnamed protein product, partial [Adineta steineri]